MEYLLENEKMAEDNAISACSILNRKCIAYGIEPFFVEVSSNKCDL